MDVSMPVGENYSGKKGPGYGNGPPSAGYGEPRRKAQRAHHCVNCVLRLLAAVATAAALTTMYKSKQTVGGARARWRLRRLQVSSEVGCRWSQSPTTASGARGEAPAAGELQVRLTGIVEAPQWNEWQ